MKSSLFKRCFALLIAVVMLTCNLPFVSFAADGEEEDIKDGITISSNVTWQEDVAEDDSVEFTYSVVINGNPFNGKAEGDDGNTYQIKNGLLVLPWNVKATIASADLEDGATYNIRRLAYDNEQYALINETAAEFGDMSATEYYVSVNGGEKEKIDAATFNAETNNGANLNITKDIDAEGNAYAADEVDVITGFDAVRESNPVQTTYSFNENTYKYVKDSLKTYNVKYTVEKSYRTESKKLGFVTTTTYYFSAEIDVEVDGLDLGDIDTHDTPSTGSSTTKSSARNTLVNNVKTSMTRLAYRVMTEGVKASTGKTALYTSDITTQLPAAGDWSDDIETLTYEDTVSTFTEVNETTYDYSTESVSVAKNIVFDATIAKAPTGSFEVDFCLYDSTPAGSKEVGFEIRDAVTGRLLEDGVDYTLEINDSTFDAVVVKVGFTKYEFTGLKAGKYTIQQNKGAAGYIVDTNKYEFEVARADGAVTGDHFAKSDLGGKYTALTNNTYSFIKTFKVFKNNSFSINFTKVDQNKETVEGATFILIERNELLNMLWTLIKNAGSSIGDFDLQSIFDMISGSDLSNFDIATILSLISTIVDQFPNLLDGLTIPAILQATSDSKGIVSFSNSSNILNIVASLLDSGLSGDALTEALGSALGGVLGDYAGLFEILFNLGDKINIHTGMVAAAYIMIETAAPTGYEKSSLVYTFEVKDDGTAYVSVGLLLPVITDLLNSQFGLDLKELLIDEEEFEKIKDTLGGAFDTFEDYSSAVIDDVVDFLAGILGEESGTENTLKRIKNSIQRYNEEFGNLAEAIGQTVKDFNSTLTDQVTEDWYYYNTRIYVDIDLHIVGCNDAYLDATDHLVTDADDNEMFVDSGNYIVNVPFGDYTLDEYNVPDGYVLDEETEENVTAVTVDSKSGEYAFVQIYHLPGEPVVTEKKATCTADGERVTRIYCELSGELLEENSEAIKSSGHTYGAWEKVKASTCTGAGGEKRVCSVCGYTETRDTDPTGHTWSKTATVDKAATCTENGSQSYHCTKCDAINNSTVIPATGHTEVVDEAVAATCTETGLTEGKHCSVCGTVTVAQQKTAALGHKIVIDKAVEPRCETTGLTEGKHCSVCNTVLVKQEIVKATGHKKVSDPMIEPSCETPGLSEGSHCDYCNKTLDVRQEIPATGHYPVIDKKVDSTCTETGLTAGTHCYKCKKVLIDQEEIPAKGHQFGEWIEVEQSTCTGEGEKMHICSVCQVREFEGTEPTGHQWETEEDSTEFKYTVDLKPTCTVNGSESIHCTVEGCGAFKDSRAIKATGHTEKKDEGYAPTCETSGLTFGYHCEVCEAVLLEQHVIEPLGHILGLWWPVYEATCTEDGLERQVCSRVNDEDSELPGPCDEVNERVIPATGHSYGEWEVATPATCTEDGVEQRVCSECGDIDERTIPAEGHTIVTDPAVPPTATEDGLTEGSHCEVCGEVIVKQEIIPAFGEPTTEEPTTDEPTTDEPTTDEPTTDEPTTDEPATGEIKLEIIDAATDKTYLIGSATGATIYCTGPLDKFVKVLVDGKEIDESCYTLAEGSTILTFTSAYLDTLAVGNHDVTLVYTYAEVSTVLTILEKTADEPTTDEPTTEEPETETTTQAPEAKPEANKKPTSPQTGSERYIAMASVAVLLAAGFAVVGRKRKEDEE